MDENSKSAIQLDPKELYFLVAKFLEASPCQEAAKVLKAELTDHQLLPLAKDWLGKERSLSYSQVENRYKHVGSQHLELVCSKLLSLLQCHNYQKLSGLNSLLGSGATESLYNRENGNKVPVLSSALNISQRCKELLLNSQRQPTANVCNLIFARSVSTNFTSHVWRSPFLYERLTKLCTILGHLAAVFCVLFDHTGRCIVTGADDDLLKVWSSRSGQLLATLRGHFAEVTDISLSPDNTMIASGSLDKSVRVWCAQSSTPVAVLLGHQSHVTSVQFSPASDEECRYLASTGKDGFLCFWQWLPDQETFSCSPIKFMEKNKMGDQTLCSTFSAGGKYFATGGTDHVLRVYVCIPGPPLLQAELEGHKGRIMSIQFGYTGEAVFATGACDATARVWRYLEGEWTSIALVVPKESIGYPQGSEKPQVTMVGWEKTDRYLVTAFTPDCVIRVWDATSGDLIKQLTGHQGEVFVLELHPTDSRILLTAGHDGLVMLWDMLSGQCLKKMEMKGEDGNHASIFDCRFSPDGLMCAAVDMNGYLTLMGFSSSEEYDKHPREQFFHTDYRPLMRDNCHYVVDEQSQVPPHLLPPPYLVDIDGNAYPIRYQEALLRLIRPAMRVTVDQSTEDVEDYDDYMKKRLSVMKQENFKFGRLRQQRVGGAKASAEDNLSNQHTESAIMETSSGDDVRLQTHSEGASSKNDDNMGKPKEDTDAVNGCSSSSLEELERRSEVVVDQNISDVVSVCSAGQGTSEDMRSPLDPRRSVEEQSRTSVEDIVRGCQGPNEGVVNHVDEDAGKGEGKGQDEEVMNRVEEEAETSSGRGKDEEVVNRVEEEAETSSGRGKNEEVVNRVEEEAETSSGRGKTEEVVNRVEEEAETSSGRGKNEEVVNRVEEDARRGGRNSGEADVDVEEESQNGQPYMQNMLSSLVYSLGLSEMETKCIIALWHNRVIIPPLEHAQLSQELAKRQQLFEEEQQNFELQNQSRRNEQATLAEGPGVLTDKGRALRSGRTLPGGGRREGSRDSESAGLDSSEEEVAGDEASVMEVERPWEDSSYDSSDISDWTQEAGIDINNILRKRTKKRRKSLDSVMSNDDDIQDEEEEEEEESSARPSGKSKLTGRTSKRKTLARGESTSLLAYSPPDWIMRTKPLLTPYLPQVGDIVIYFHQGHRIYVDSVQEEKLYPIHKSTFPWQKYMLMPQELCQVTNVRYSVGQLTLCCITLTLLQPFSQSVEEGSDGGVACRTTNGDSSKDGQRDRIRFSFKYHDMDSVLDFLILESLYKISVRTCWQVGDRFHSLIDGKYWFGTIREKKPFSQDCPNSYWQSCLVLWDDGASDLLSPWDMEAIPQRHHPGPDPSPDPSPDPDPNSELSNLDHDPDHDPDHDLDPDPDHDPDHDLDPDPDHDPDHDPDPDLNSDSSNLDHDLDPKPELDPDLGPSSADVPEEATSSRLSELLALQKAGEKQAWGGEGEPARILHGLELVESMDEAFMFLKPVNLDQVPEYCTTVAFPTDLHTIKEKLRNGLYRRKQALLWELTLIAKNAVTFNEEDSLIVKHARVLVQTLGEFIKSPGVADPMECYTPEPRGEVEEEVHLNLPEKDVVLVDPINLPLPPPPPVQDGDVECSSSPTSLLLPSPSSLTPSSSDPASNGLLWLDKATAFLGEIMEHDGAKPFLEPIDTAQFEDYLDYVKEPLDFNTIRKKLVAGCYPIPQDFVSDIRLIFMNSRLYNKKGSEIYKLTNDLQFFFDRRLAYFLQGFIGYPYQTRRTSGRTSDISTTSTMAPSVTSSVSSMDDSSTVSVQDQYREGGGRASVCRRARGRKGGRTGRSQRRAVETSNKDSGGSDSGAGGKEEEGEEEEDGRSSTRSVSASISNHDYHHRSCVPVTRRQTRSMRKDVTPSSPEADEVLMDEERFSMTLRTRSRRKRKRFYDSEEDEEEEVEAEEESIGEASEEESVGEKRQTRGRKGRPCIKQDVRSTRKLRKRLKQTKYFDDENSHDRIS